MNRLIISLFRRARIWILRKMIGRLAIVANLTVRGGVVISADREVLIDARFEGAGDDARDPYEWFTPQRPVYAAVVIEDPDYRIMKTKSGVTFQPLSCP